MLEQRPLKEHPSVGPHDDCDETIRDLRHEVEDLKHQLVTALDHLGRAREANENLRAWQCYWLLEQMREAWGMYPGQTIGVAEIDAFLFSRAVHPEQMPDLSLSGEGVGTEGER